VNASVRLRVVIDTNQFVSGTISKQGNPYQLIHRWRTGAFTVVTCAWQREEIAGVLQRPKIRERYRLSDGDIAALLLYIDTTAEFVTPEEGLPLVVRDPNDQLILGTAIAGAAQYLVSGDHDLLILRDEPLLRNLQILTVAEFLTLLP
jgi:putative PIN family toxin of toxin-antitoxin system